MQISFLDISIFTFCRRRSSFQPEEKFGDHVLLAVFETDRTDRENPLAEITFPLSPTDRHCLPPPRRCSMSSRVFPLFLIQDAGQWLSVASQFAVATITTRTDHFETLKLPPFQHSTINSSDPKPMKEHHCSVFFLNRKSIFYRLAPR